MAIPIRIRRVDDAVARVDASRDQVVADLVGDEHDGQEVLPEGLPVHRRRGLAGVDVLHGARIDVEPAVREIVESRFFRGLRSTEVGTLPSPMAQSVSGLASRYSATMFRFSALQSS